MPAAILVADIKDEVSQRKNGTVVIVEVLLPAFGLGDQGLLCRRQRHQSLQSLGFHLDQELCWLFSACRLIRSAFTQYPPDSPGEVLCIRYELDWFGLLSGELLPGTQFTGSRFRPVQAPAELVGRFLHHVCVNVIEAHEDEC